MRTREDFNRASVQKKLNGTLERGANAHVGNTDVGKGKGKRSRSPSKGKSKGKGYDRGRSYDRNNDDEPTQNSHKGQTKGSSRGRSPSKGKGKGKGKPRSSSFRSGSKGKGKGKGKADRSRSPSKGKGKGKGGKKPCPFFAKGICTHGDKCWNSHEGGSAQANAASANPANTEPKPKKNKKKTLYGTPAKSSGAVAIMIAAVASCIQAASGFVGSCVLSNPIMHLNQSMLLEQPQGCVSKVGRKGPIVFDTDHSIVEFEVDHEMWKYGEHENCTDRLMFGADEAYKMVAASSEKDHYLAFKRAKKLAKYIYKNVCSAAFSFTRPNIVTPVAWLSDTGASCDLIGKEC